MRQFHPFSISTALMLLVASAMGCGNLKLPGSVGKDGKGELPGGGSPISSLFQFRADTSSQGGMESPLVGPNTFVMGSKAGGGISSITATGIHIKVQGGIVGVH